MSGLKITVLGCGNSTGVPAIGNYWGSCDPLEPKNRRTRSSIAVQSANTTLIIDTGPDFREQMNRADIKNLDAVLYTHMHGDHVSGIDDLRVITHRNKRLTPVYGDPATLKELTQRFGYLFNGGDADIYPPMLAPNPITNFGQIQKINDIEFVPFKQDHGTCESVGYRFGNFGYSVDILTLDEVAIETLHGIKIWMVDSAGYKSQSPVHATMEEIYALNKKIGAAQVYLTSLSLAMDYKTLQNELPPGFAPAYDGLILTP